MKNMFHVKFSNDLPIAYASITYHLLGENCRNCIRWTIQWFYCLYINMYFLSVFNMISVYSDLVVTDISNWQHCYLSITGLDWAITGLDWAITVMDWAITGLDWAVTVMDWAVTVMDWAITGMDRAIAGMDWAITGLDWAVTVMDWAVTVMD